MRIAVPRYTPMWNEDAGVKVKIEPLEISGAALITPAPFVDERGAFARVFCADTFAEAGLPSVFVQANTSFNSAMATWRGLHWQDDRAPEAKLVRCTRGALVDVIVDMRPTSPTYLRALSVPLDEKSGQAVLVPPLCAHGFLTLEPKTEVFYMTTQAYTPDAECGARFDDPALALKLLLMPQIVSQKDQTWPDLKL